MFYFFFVLNKQIINIINNLNENNKERNVQKATVQVMYMR